MIAFLLSFLNFGCPYFRKVIGRVFFHEIKRQIFYSYSFAQVAPEILPTLKNTCEIRNVYLISRKAKIEPKVTILYSAEECKKQRNQN